MKVLKRLDENAEEIVLSILLAAMACIMFMQVIARFVFNNSLTWSEELTRYLFVWSTFIGIPYCIRKRLNIQIEILTDALSAAGKRIMAVIVDLIQLCMFAMLLSPAITYLERTIENGQTSAALRLPMQYVYAAPLVGFLLASLRLIQDIVAHVKEHKGEENKK